MSYKYFKNNKCEYFPCHNTANIDNFNCLFCYCPLYTFEECNGNYTILENGIKDCSQCLIPHKQYEFIVSKLIEHNNNTKAKKGDKQYE